MLEQDSQLREFAQILDRYRCDLEPALAFGNDNPFRRQPVEDLAQRRNAEPVILLHRVELQPSRRIQHAEDDVGANAVIAAVAGRHGGLGLLQDRQRLSRFWAREGGRLAGKHNRDWRPYAESRSYGEIINIIYLSHYHLTMLSVYGFHRKRPG